MPLPRLTVCLLLFILLQSVCAQNTVGTKEQLAAFLKTTTCVVLESDPMLEYNVQVKAAVNENWKITEFEFISVEEYEKRRKSDQYSFITMDQVYFDGDKSITKYNFLCLSLGGNYKTTSDMPQLCTIPVSYLGVDEESWAYKLGTLIRFMQNHVLLTSGDPALKNSNILDYYKQNLPDLSGKVLFLVADELSDDMNTEAEIKSLYPWSFKFVTRDDLETAIDENRSDVVFLHKVGPESSGSKKARCYKILIGAGDAKLYYFDYHMIDDKHPDALLSGDFRKIAKKPE